MMDKKISYKLITIEYVTKDVYQPKSPTSTINKKILRKNRNRYLKKT